MSRLKRAFAPAASVVTEPCRRVRSGLGTAYACASHGNPWPCKVGSDPDAQLELFGRALPIDRAVLAEVAAERLRHVDEGHTPESDIRLTAEQWAQRLAELMNRALAAGRRAGHTAAPADVAAYRLALIQEASVALAAVAALDKLNGGPTHA